MFPVYDISMIGKVKYGKENSGDGFSDLADENSSGDGVVVVGC